MEAKKAGLTAEKIDAAVEKQAEMARGGMVAKKAMAKGGAVKVKKERSPAQKAATAKMLAALKASKAKK